MICLQFRNINICDPEAVVSG